jgi:histidyl-tRNA synthetase
LRGLLQHFSVPENNSNRVLRILDKVDMETPPNVRRQLEFELDRSASRADELLSVVTEARDTEETLRLLLQYPECEEGVEDLTAIVQAIRQYGVPETAFGVDLSVVRGLDYYTGTIYETTLLNAPHLGSICSGGRYDDLASYFTDTKLPGVGISIGLTRLFAGLKEGGLLQPLARTPAEVLVTTIDSQSFDKYLKMASSLREAGINTEVYLESAKIDKQLAYANKKGFSIALIAGENEFARDSVQVKNLNTRDAHDVSLSQLIAAVQKSLATKDT